MTHPAKSVLVHGIYLAVSGATLIVSPNTLFALVGLARTSEVWVRVVGVLTLILAFYFIQAARQNVIEFIRWTVYARVTFMVFMTAFVLLGFVGPVLILFGVVDLLGAIWTTVALRAAKNS